MVKPRFFIFTILDFFFFLACFALSKSNDFGNKIRKYGKVCAIIVFN